MVLTPVLKIIIFRRFIDETTLYSTGMDQRFCQMKSLDRAYGGHLIVDIRASKMDTYPRSGAAHSRLRCLPPQGVMFVEAVRVVDPFGEQSLLDLWQRVTSPAISTPHPMPMRSPGR